MRQNKFTSLVKPLFSFLISSEGSLKHKVFKGTFWVFSAKISNVALGFIRTIVLARVLAPADFGLFGLAMLTIGALEAFSQTGVQQALIQKQEKTENYLDAAWTLQVLRGFGIGTMLLAGSFWAGTFFNEVRVVSIIQVLAISEIMKGFINIGVVYFEKELAFHKQFIYQLSASIADISVSVFAAIMMRSVWALVLGILAKSIIQLTMSYMLHGYRPKIMFDKEKILTLINYGKWIMGVSVLVFIGSQGDDLFVGKAVGVVALGFYQMAYNFSQLPSIQFTNVINGVAFPTYSQVQGDLERLRNAYFKISGLTTMFSIPFAAGLGLFAHEFTFIFLGEKWLPIVNSIQILALAALIKSIISTGSALFYGVGKPRLEFNMQAIRAFIILISIYPLASTFGIEGAAVTVLLSAVGMFILWMIQTSSVLKIQYQKLLNLIAQPVLATLAMSILVFFIKSFFDITTIIGSFTQMSLFMGVLLLTMTVYLLSALWLEKFVLNTRTLLNILQTLPNKFTRQK